MDLKNKNLSLQFYDYLCNIVGSEEVARTRREIFTAKDTVETTTGFSFISSGSKAEGLDLKGSDYDLMLTSKFMRVYESLNEDQCDPKELQMVMETKNTKPGFTKIKLVKKAYLVAHMINHWCETVEDETYISSKRYREFLLPDDMVIHGPCQTTTYGDCDFAQCLRCNEWITQAQQWIHRTRTAWPHYTLVSSAVRYGVLFVPIGCKNSPNEDLQWRISFSVTEKLLIHSFFHTQLLCYASMKIILKDIIKPKHDDLLCSYFLKTIMFWVSEEINPSEWKPENMISCFVDCIRRLIYCVEYKTCLHYFIPENNLFENRFTDKEHRELMNTLRFIYEFPWISVFESSTFQNYRLDSVSSHGMVLSASELPCFFYIGTAHVSSVYNSIKRFVNVGLNKDLCTYMISLLAKYVLQSSHLCNMMVRNKSFYQQYKRSLCYFKINSLTSSISSWLLLASLFYKCKRYQECLDIINYCLYICTPDRIYLHYANSFDEQTGFSEIKQKWGLLHAFRYLMIDNVRFQHPFCLLPDELMPLTCLIDGRCCVIPPVVYSFLLQFLCRHQLWDKKEKHDALHNLELTVREQYLIIHCKDTSRIVYTSLKIVRALI